MVRETSTPHTGTSPARFGLADLNFIRDLVARKETVS